MLSNGITSESSMSLLQFKYKYLFYTIFISLWATSCVAAVKLISVFGITFTGGFLIFPFTSLCCTTLVEIYGFKSAREAAWCGLIFNTIFIFFISLVSILPSSPYWSLQNEYNLILLQSIRILFASIISFLISYFINAYLMSVFKLRSHGKNLIQRILISNTTSNLIDIICFITIAFMGVIPHSALLKLLFFAAIKKFLCELAFLPIAWYLIDKIKSKEGKEVFDLNTNFSPFSLDNVYDFQSIKISNESKVNVFQNTLVMK